MNDTATRTDTNTATDKQIAFIKTLQADRAWENSDAAQRAVELSNELWRRGAFDTKAASAMIEVLKSFPYKTRQESAPAAAAPVQDVDLEGMHRVGDEIFKVQRAVHGSGNLYAKRLVMVEPDCGGCANGEPCGAGCAWSASFEYAPGIVRTLSAETKMTLEQAKEFGALYGTCCVCGRTLTDEKSIEAGIGPVCAGKF